MPRTRPSLVGMRYGRLVVLSQGPTRHAHRTWNCQCDCGGTALVGGVNLKRGKTKSCGCLRIDVAGSLVGLKKAWKARSEKTDARRIHNQVLDQDWDA